MVGFAQPVPPPPRAPPVPHASPSAKLALGQRPPAWLAEFWRRITHRFWLKAIGITAFMWLFFAAYFHLLRHPVYAVVQMPLTAVDRALPFQPGWLGVYVSLWLYVGIAPNLLMRLREL